MKFDYQKLYINGELADAQTNERHEVICPATDEVISEVAKASPADAQIALEAAKEAFIGWSVLPLEERIAWLHKMRDAIAKNRKMLEETLMFESGKPYGEAEMELGVIIDSITYFCDAMTKQTKDTIEDREGDCNHEIRYEPLGVAVSYLPWNFPLETLSFKLAPALVAGCTLIVKPSPATPLSTYLLGKLCHEINFPKGVFQILYGDNDVLPQVLSSSKIPAILSAVGSCATGRKILEQGNTSLKKYCFELGGNAPAIIFDDASVDTAVDIISGFKFFNAGQICIDPNRIFVHKTVFPEVEQGLINSCENVKIGFGKESGANMGPLTDKNAQARIHAWVEEAISMGAELVCGGDLSAVPEKGSYYPPTILKGVTPDMMIYQGEIFGPVISLIEFEDDNEVLEMANDTEAGLTSYIFTENDDRIDKFSRSLDFGEVMVNKAKWGDYLPHIGIKQSGMGCVGSPRVLKEFQRMKRVTSRM
tara:strand:+ start:84236 stop:85672 length:1437 start_codon:yes stop_codon:yes gene_type:complete